MKKNNNTALKICYCSVFAAFTCACTFISIPLPFGYFNLGDMIILLCSWTMGPLYGAISACVGAGLADLLMGYTIYVPATMVIKSAMAVVAYYLYALIKRRSDKPSVAFISRAVSAVAAEAVMVVGYFMYDFIFFYGIGALASVPGNVLQGVCAVIGGVLLGRLIERAVGDRLHSKK